MSVNEVKIKPAPFELEVRGTGHPSSRTYAIGDEDHTLGNAIRHVLMQNSNVDFAGYSVPHPSEPVVHIRVQTAKKINKTNRSQQQQDSDDVDEDEDSGRLPATDVLKEACETLISQCDVLLDAVEDLMPEVRKDRMDLEDVLRNEGFDEENEDEEEEVEDAGDYDEEMM
jgi:DNA-directed RNA polymerase I and III subunit RPAC2